MKNEIVANNLTAGYGQGFHFENLNLIIPSGKITSLIGANGSGKSTILKTMSRLIQPTHGEVYIDGKSIFHMNTREVAKKLAILPQSATAPEGISVEELVANGRFPHISGMRRLSVEDREIVHWAMEACNIEELSKKGSGHPFRRSKTEGLDCYGTCTKDRYSVITVVYPTGGKYPSKW